MGSYKGRLTKSEPYQGVQAVLYKADSDIKVDVDVTNEEGYFEFLDVDPGQYQVRFFGGDYTEEDYIDISILDEAQFISRHYIRPKDGTVIKNGSGTLTFELMRFNGSVQEIVTSGDVKLYKKDSNGKYIEIQDSDTGVLGDGNGNVYNGYSIKVDETFIGGQESIYAANKSEGDEYDSVTMADISDSKGFVSWVEPSSYVATYDPEADTYSPATITLTPEFAFDGNVLNPGSDPNFTFTSGPDVSATGISWDSSTGVVTVDTDVYFGSNTEYTGSWQAEYIDDQTYTIGASETVYLAQQGANAKLLTMMASSQVFKEDQDGNQSPTSISLDTLSQNISIQQPL